MGGGAGAYRAAPSEQPSLEFFRSSENRLTLGKGVSKPMYRSPILSRGYGLGHSRVLMLSGVADTGTAIENRPTRKRTSSSSGGDKGSRRG